MQFYILKAISDAAIEQHQSNWRLERLVKKNERSSLTRRDQSFSNDRSTIAPKERGCLSASRWNVSFSPLRPVIRFDRWRWAPLLLSWKEITRLFLLLSCHRLINYLPRSSFNLQKKNSFFLSLSAREIEGVLQVEEWNNCESAAVPCHPRKELIGCCWKIHECQVVSALN